MIVQTAVRTFTNAQQSRVKERFKPTWRSLQQFQVPDWYLNAKFGVFIHWGVASVPAYQTEWYPKWMYKRGHDIFEHHARVHGQQGVFGYKDFIPRFTMDRWNPDAWAELFQASGAKYVVPVAEHHDGFALYDYSNTRWNSLKAGPKRDLIGELGDAVRAKGLKYGVSSHRAYNWRFFTYESDFDTTDPEYADLYARPHQPESPADQDFLNDWLQRGIELVDKYRPDLVWFDWCIGWPEFESFRRRFAAHYYNAANRWNTGVVINYKEDDFVPGTGVWDIERGQLDEIRPDFWQTDTSISRNGWAYNANPDNKSASSLIHDLTDIVSKNGCLLLNIGPRPDGTITQEQEQVLRDIGDWLSINGEAIYGTRPWTVFGEGPTRVKAGTFQECENNGFSSDDVRFTVNGKTLYATTLGVPDDNQMIIRSLGSDMRLFLGDIASVEMLGGQGELAWKRERQGLRIKLPDLSRLKHGISFRIKTLAQERPKRTADATGSHTHDIDASS